MPSGEPLGEHRFDSFGKEACKMFEDSKFLYFTIKDEYESEKNK